MTYLSPMSESILTDARIVTRDGVVDGTLVLREGRIADIQPGASRAAGAQSVDGDYLLPGLVELHTDNLEKHLTPRPGVLWPPEAAIVAHDALVAGCGITTVLDSVAVGDVIAGTQRRRSLEVTPVGLANALRHGMLKADHFLHMRIEVSEPDVREMFEPFLDDPLVRLVSLMDHTPGQRQYADEAAYRRSYQRRHNIDDAAYEQFSARRKALAEQYSQPHRSWMIALSRSRGWPLASHDDATLEHVAESVAAHMTIAEFPTTVAAADAAHGHGLKVLMGAPNLVRGGSHSGNVSAGELAARGVVDILSSDYYPQSLLHGAFLLSRPPIGMALADAVATVSDVPAAAVGLHDRGRIEAGLRADVIRVCELDGLPIVRSVWREGRRVA
ncbi:alpha-D-ribose 1-methylphosphonate 5-triphosphate diphosphatase [Stella humosa]|uniref:Alpha-D-ribose 1-methylphosphonate 5-triphosphate diphosphatase n=1 Tax=Stella humosa TaxID=94 RepID=A0A3N1MGL5_9PROT|nr:alpha-D-ribose 1-methylphosphonate 5-triphosphate diphosphatase [Stella humosa]ROQ01770.1 alpha-D-ribose 1-methylphosphonate 5-triphosphate diphosphatase [Stella humosa]BBK32154.1 phosphonate metabolism protein PhnM [Stella humosa]